MPTASASVSITPTITDWQANYGAESAYAAQVAQVAMRLSGADVVVPMGGMMRASDTTSATVQPPAAEAHVDFTESCADRIAERLYRTAHPAGPGYRRFIAFSLWRALSAPPQDMPVALCEGRSVRDDEGTHNTKVDVAEIPTGEALYAPIEGEENMAAATIFHHSPAHRWWYFPDMTPDEVIFIKFYDSDHGTAWRCPHTAFRDHTRPDARPRHSMEFRGMAYFSTALKPHAACPRQVAAASSASLTHQPCTWGRRRCAMLTRATGPAATLPASRIHSACLKSASPVC